MTHPNTVPAHGSGKEWLAASFDELLTSRRENAPEAAGGRSMKQALLLWVLTLSLSACALQAKMNALDGMKTSKAASKECLMANPNKVSVCQAEQLSYQADLKAYEATAGAMSASR